ncbi:MAG: hypothetical protein WA491_13410 [Candidatus Acidiferrum sp.]
MIAENLTIGCHVRKNSIALRTRSVDSRGESTCKKRSTIAFLKCGPYYTPGNLGAQATLSTPVVRCCLLVFPREEPAAAPQRRGSTNESVFAMKKNVWRAVIEVAFIIFLFYSNLLMGEFERSGMGQKRGLAWAIRDVLTAANFEIATIAALMGYVLFEFLRNKF